MEMREYSEVGVELARGSFYFRGAMAPNHSKKCGHFSVTNAVCALRVKADMSYHSSLVNPTLLSLRITIAFIFLCFHHPLQQGITLRLNLPISENSGFMVSIYDLGMARRFLSKHRKNSSLDSCSMPSHVLRV